MEERTEKIIFCSFYHDPKYTNTFGLYNSVRERIFCSGRVLTIWRSRLTPKYLEMAVYLKDWFDVKRRTKGKAVLDEEFEQDDDEE